VRERQKAKVFTPTNSYSKKHRSSSCRVVSFRFVSFRFVSFRFAVYGFTGAPSAKLPCIPIASSVTSYGRSAIERTKEYIERTRPGSEVIYGDSVGARMPVVMMRPNAERMSIHFMAIEDIAKTWIPHGRKEYGILRESHTHIWSSTGFVRIEKIIRHLVRPSVKRMYRVCTSLGFVDVTQDHSLLLRDGTPAPPTQRHLIGTELLHGDHTTMFFPKCCNILEEVGVGVGAAGAADDEDDATINGDYASCTNGVQAQCALWMMHNDIGLNPYNYVTVSPDRNDETPNGACTLRGYPSLPGDERIPTETSYHHRVRTITDVTHLYSKEGTDEPFYVYDLKTENHTFGAGVGRIVVHNTDSVMVRFPPETVPGIAAAIELGKVLADEITRELFPWPMRLQFEKVGEPFLLLKKKKYIMLHWTNPDKPDFLNMKGVETVRRDNCPMVPDVLNEMIDFIMNKKDVDGAVRAAKNAVSALLTQQVPMEKLTISKKLTRRPDQYVGKQAHVECARRMRRRDRETAPVMGDRVGYVIVSGGTKCISDRSEDPAWCERRGLQLDTTYYIDQQLRKPLERIMEPIIGKSATRNIFEGDHTRRRVVKLPKSGGLMSYFSVATPTTTQSKTSSTTPSTSSSTSSSSSSSSSSAKRYKKSPEKTLQDYFF